MLYLYQKSYYNRRADMVDLLLGLKDMTKESFMVSVLVRLLSAAVCGGIIGFERLSLESPSPK